MWHLTVTQQSCFRGDAHECADGIEHVDEKECEDDDEHVDGKDVGKVEFEGDRGYGGRETGHAGKCGLAQRDAEECRPKDAEQQGAADVEDEQCACQHEADDGEQSGAGGDVPERDERGGAGGDDAAVL